MDGQLAFDWNQLENFLITRNRSVGNKVTNAKYQSWVSGENAVYHRLSKRGTDRRQSVHYA